MIGKSAIDLTFWVDINQRNDIIKRLKLEGSCKLIPVKISGKNGEIKEILFSAREIILNNSPYMLAIPLDITCVLNLNKGV